MKKNAKIINLVETFIGKKSDAVFIDKRVNGCYRMKLVFGPHFTPENGWRSEVESIPGVKSAWFIRASFNMQAASYIGVYFDRLPSTIPIRDIYYLKNGIEIHWGNYPPRGNGENEIRNIPVEALDKLRPMLLEAETSGIWNDQIESIMEELLGEYYEEVGTDNLYEENGSLYTM